MFNLLNANERFAVSIGKTQDLFIKYGERRVRVYPDTAEATSAALTKAGFVIETVAEQTFAYLFAAKKSQ